MAYTEGGNVKEGDTYNNPNGDSYDYFNIFWYKYAKKEFEKGKEEVWTPIYQEKYKDEAYWAITFASSVRDNEGKLIGISGSEWYIEDLWNR